MGVEVLDLQFRIPGQAVGWYDLVSAPDADPIFAGGSVATTDGATSVNVSIEASQELLNATANALQQPSGTEFVLVNEDGTTPSGYGISAFSSVSLINGQWELNSGTFTDPEGTAIDFFAATDPVPAIVWIVLIGASACLLKVGIDSLVDDCRAAVAQDIQSCVNSGGLPSLRIHTTYGFGYEASQLRIGCGKTCVVDCRP